MEPPKKLYRSTSDNWLTGVCGGLGEYFGVDANVIRLGVAILAVLTGFFPLLIVYVLAAIIVPSAPAGTATTASPAAAPAAPPATAPLPTVPAEPPAPAGPGSA